MGNPQHSQLFALRARCASQEMNRCNSFRPFRRRPRKRLASPANPASPPSRRQKLHRRVRTSTSPNRLLQALIRHQGRSLQLADAMSFSKAARPE
jgi:hypothetical protein